jgi:hypothetical protein
MRRLKTDGDVAGATALPALIALVEQQHIVVPRVEHGGWRHVDDLRQRLAGVGRRHR